MGGDSLGYARGPMTRRQAIGVIGAGLGSLALGAKRVGPPRTGKHDPGGKEP